MIFLNSHPIQYYAPLYKYLTESGMDVDVWYCSDSSIKGELDKGFGVNVRWDIPILEGYKSRFFKNNASNPSVMDASFWGIVNWGLLKAIWKEPKSVFVVNGWQYFSYLLTIIWAKVCGHRVALRAEMPWNQEQLKQGRKNKAKLWVLKNILFRFVNHFLYIGTHNKNYYENLGVDKSKMAFTPYAVDNARFTEAANSLKPQATSLRVQLGLPVDRKIILYSGKYISKKRPVDLVKAYSKIANENMALVMVGDGELRGEMEALIAVEKIPSVYLTGFINQTEIVKYYAIADVFVMCSDIGETWGLSVNEALNFGLPLLVSDTTGSSLDLVRNGENGFVFRTGAIDEMAEKLESLLKDDTFNTRAIDISKELVSIYSYQKIKEGLDQIL